LIDYGRKRLASRRVHDEMLDLHRIKRVRQIVNGDRIITGVIRSLAVLPLESLSSEASQDYFADGMTDELISDLGQISALRVISRTAVMTYKHARKPLPQIARELNVDAVVHGAVDRSRHGQALMLPELRR
jgi:TolB-like protein